MNRRNFLKNTGLASTSLVVPQFLSGYTNQGFTNNGRNLVIIQWSGGNDGLNTIVPFHNDLYYRNRPSLAIQKNEVIKITDELGFNPIMSDFKKLYDDGLVSIINNVGYPNPSRSHFRSMDIWHTASDSNKYWQTGWLGRYLDEVSPSDYQSHTGLQLDDSLVLALRGNKNSGFAVSELNRLRMIINNNFLKKIAHHHEHEHEENVAYLYKTLIDTQSSADYLTKKSNAYKTRLIYPKTGIGKDLKKISSLIISDANTKIYYINIGGFDTHASQKRQQSRLLREYSEAIAVFVKDLKENSKLDDTLIMTFSEFGRRVKENASKGTDHGTANNLYLIGGKLKKPGFFNEAPNLSTLDNGDLIYSVDFRKIYASILEKWMNVDSKNVLTKKFQPLNLI